MATIDEREAGTSALVVARTRVRSSGTTTYAFQVVASNSTSSILDCSIQEEKVDIKGRLCCLLIERRLDLFYGCIRAAPPSATTILLLSSKHPPRFAILPHGFSLLFNIQNFPLTRFAANARDGGHDITSIKMF